MCIVAKSEKTRSGETFVMYWDSRKRSYFLNANEEMFVCLRENETDSIQEFNRTIETKNLLFSL